MAVVPCCVDGINPLLALRVSGGVRPLILCANLRYNCCRESSWYLPESCSILDMLDSYFIKPVQEFARGRCSDDEMERKSQHAL